MTQDYNSEPAEYAVPNTRVIDFKSSVNDRELRLIVALPLLPPPPSGSRVLYVLDGNGYSATAAEAVRWNMNAPDVLVVGIAYPETPEFNSASLARHGPPSEREAHLPPFPLSFVRERMFDLSLPLNQSHIDEYCFAGVPRHPSLTGGVDALLETIERDIKPRIAALAPVDVAGTALFGHSLGGVAVLRALFTRPDMFRTFIAASPAIWWGDRAVLEEEAGFADKVRQGKATPRVLVTMGSEESSLPRGAVAALVTEKLKDFLLNLRMVEEADELVARLRAIKGAPGYEVAPYAVFPEQQHGIAAWPAIGRAVDFAFQR